MSATSLNLIIGLLAACVVGVCTLFWLKKYRVAELTMETLTTYAQKFMTKHPEDNGVSFVLFYSDALPPEMARYRFPAEAKYIITVWTLNKTTNEPKKCVGILTAKNLDAATLQALKEKTLIIER